MWHSSYTLPTHSWVMGRGHSKILVGTSASPRESPHLCLKMVQFVVDERVVRRTAYWAAWQELPFGSQRLQIVWRNWPKSESLPLLPLQGTFSRSTAISSSAFKRHSQLPVLFVQQNQDPRLKFWLRAPFPLPHYYAPPSAVVPMNKRLPFRLPVLPESLNRTFLPCHWVIFLAERLTFARQTGARLLFLISVRRNPIWFLNKCWHIPASSVCRSDMPSWVPEFGSSSILWGSK